MDTRTEHILDGLDVLISAYLRGEEWAMNALLSIRGDEHKFIRDWAVDNIKRLPKIDAFEAEKKAKFILECIKRMKKLMFMDKVAKAKLRNRILLLDLDALKLLWRAMHASVDGTTRCSRGMIFSKIMDEECGEQLGDFIEKCDGQLRQSEDITKEDLNAAYKLIKKLRRPEFCFSKYINRIDLSSEKTLSEDFCWDGLEFSVNDGSFNAWRSSSPSALAENSIKFEDGKLHIQFTNESHKLENFAGTFMFDEELAATDIKDYNEFNEILKNESLDQVIAYGEAPCCDEIDDYYARKDEAERYLLELMNGRFQNIPIVTIDEKDMHTGEDCIAGLSLEKAEELVNDMIKKHLTTYFGPRY